MKAMLLERIVPIDNSPLRLAELPLPEPQRGEVRLKVRCCAICRTDLHVIEGDLPQQKMPIIPGHQVVGTVDALGPGCRRFQLGQRAGVAWLRHTCGTCAHCSRGRENLCESARFTGYHADGGYAEYAVVPESAHMVIQIAQHRGCQVYVVTRGEKHVELARQMGAVWAGQRAEELPVKVDSAILFAPAGELVPPALESLNKGGTLALAGIHMTPIPAMDYQRYVFFERDIHSVTCNTRQDGAELLAEASAIPIRPHTTVYPLSDANLALQDLKNDRISGTGVLAMD
jgi:propanol-preferring alcohol dehydrogenase